ncbi:MAG: 16S rRNA (adenine(1518)-N(6)/adenine(1519)-N(6))-dimethyltransferase RsmA [Nitrospinota bacterium]
MANPRTRAARRRRLGQHFLRDRRVMEKILAAAQLSPEDRVFEVGAGQGALTRELAARARAVVALEVDRKLAEGLAPLVGEFPNIRLLCCDARRFDLSQLPSPPPWKLVANLPYRGGAQILLRCLDRPGLFSRLVVTLQREVAERLCAAPGEKAYGSLSLHAQYRARIQVVAHVPPGAFQPPPEVDSSIVLLLPRARPPVEVEDEGLFFSLLRSSFAHRRKTLLNNLKALRNAPFEAVSWEEVLEASGIDGSLRGEALSLADFARLAATLSRRRG